MKAHIEATYHAAQRARNSGEAGDPSLLASSLTNKDFEDPLSHLERRAWHRRNLRLVAAVPHYFSHRWLEPRTLDQRSALPAVEGLHG